MTSKHKQRMERRSFAYVYLLYRLFDGNQSEMLLTMEKVVPDADTLKEWDNNLKEAVSHTIEKENESGPKKPAEVPTIKSIKEKVLMRVDNLIAATTDPARLAQVYKTLSEFEGADDRKEKSVVDAIGESIRPGKNFSVLDKMKAEGMANPNIKRGRGRPRKNPIFETAPAVEESVVEEMVEEPIADPENEVEQVNE